MENKNLTADNSPQETNLSFEQALARLEAILQKMDSGEILLDETMSLYKEGLELIEICQKYLNQAQGQLRVFDESRQKEANNE